MEIDKWSLEDEIKDVRVGRPHLVLLGAGASLATLPEGDVNGTKLPVMDNFIDIVGLKPILKKYGINTRTKNFERLYSKLVLDPKFKDAILEVEDHVRSYFLSLKLPETPTIYDHLVLSLRAKDVIATFNWDPLLVQAAQRNSRFVKPPRILFLHGCVSLGVDFENKAIGPVGRASSGGKVFEPMRILYPVEEKDYNADPFVKSEWDTLRAAMKSAYIFTIFGYGAPSSDVEAIRLMKDAWGDVEKREYEETEIIDIKSEDELSNRWKQFIHTHHYRTSTSFYDSSIANHPRRSCEAMWNQLMECKWIDNNPIPKDLDFDELYAWLKPYVEAEKQ